MVRIKVVRTVSTNARVTVWGSDEWTSSTGNTAIANVTTTFSNTNIIKVTGQSNDGGGTYTMNVQSADIKWFPQNL
jgi:hypothetical protein